MSLVQLSGKTPKGSDKLHEARTNIWEVIKVRDTVAFEPSGRGKWLLVTPKGQSAFHACVRWVHQTNDVDFEVKLYD